MKDYPHLSVELAAKHITGKLEQTLVNRTTRKLISAVFEQNTCQRRYEAVYGRVADVTDHSRRSSY